jgi:hypothetical protein
MEKLRKALIVLLGLAMVMGPFVSVAQASDMAVAMDMSGGAQGDCNGCADGDDGDAAQCVPVCAVAGFALLPAVSTQDAKPVADLPLPLHLVSRGRLSSPDPYPPEPRNLS